MSFSTRNKAVKNMQSQVWYRGKVGFIASVTLITVVIVSFLVGASLKLNEPPESNAVNNTATENIDWTCSLYFHNETFIVTVDVNLTDGMNLEEAIRVATTVFNVTMGQNKLYGLRSADEDENGIWKIEFGWEYATATPLYLGHWFEATINPFNQTVVYNRCK